MFTLSKWTRVFEFEIRSKSTRIIVADVIEYRVWFFIHLMGLTKFLHIAAAKIKDDTVNLTQAKHHHFSLQNISFSVYVFAMHPLPTSGVSRTKFPIFRMPRRTHIYSFTIRMTLIGSEHRQINHSSYAPLVHTPLYAKSRLCVWVCALRVSKQAGPARSPVTIYEYMCTYICLHISWMVMTTVRDTNTKNI